MRADGPGGPGRDDSGKRDLAYRLLAAAVALMRPGRRDWGLAMLAELEHVCRPGERAWFALGAARVALFPPRATRPWRAVPLGLAIRAVAAGAAMHALAPAAGLAPAALMALPAAGVWTMLTTRALAGRPGGAVLAAQVTVAAGIAGFLVLYLTVVQHYPQVMGPGNHHGWGAGLAFNLASAGYLGMAWLLPRQFAVTQRNILYALAVGLVIAAAAARDIAHPPGISQYALACLALPAAAALAGIRRGRLEDGLETALWATLLASLATSIMIAAEAYRVAPSVGRQPAAIADARLHGMSSASAWLAADSLGGASFLLILTPIAFLVLAAGGAILGCRLRGPLDRAISAWGPWGQRPKRRSAGRQ